MKSNKSLTYQALVDHKEGLVFVTSGEDSIINQSILNLQDEQASSIIIEFKNKFTDFYIGLSLDTLDMEAMVAPKLKHLSNSLEVKMLPVHQTSYLDQDDKSL